MSSSLSLFLSWRWWRLKGADIIWMSKLKKQKKAELYCLEGFCHVASIYWTSPRSSSGPSSHILKWNENTQTKTNVFCLNPNEVSCLPNLLMNLHVALATVVVQLLLHMEDFNNGSPTTPTLLNQKCTINIFILLLSSSTEELVCTCITEIKLRMSATLCAHAPCSFPSFLPFLLQQDRKSSFFFFTTSFPSVITH